MRKAIAVLGIAGLGMAGGNAPAVAAPVANQSGALICHLTESGTYEPFLVSRHGMIHNLNGHGSHSGDIIPFPGFGGSPAGQNMTPENVVIFNNGCVGAAGSPAGPAVPAPPANPAVPAPPANPGKAPGVASTNLGYNVDTGVQAQPVRTESGHLLPTWLGWASGLLAAGCVWTVWGSRAHAKGSAR